MRVFHTPYNSPPGRVAVSFEGEVSMTKQSMKAECDINNILRRFAKTGVLEHVTGRAARFVDVSQVTDYRAALDHVRSADEYFSRLPAKVRARFKNDAAEFLDFVSDAKNEAEAVELGLLQAKKVEPAVPAAAPVGAPVTQ